MDTAQVISILSQLRDGADGDVVQALNTATEIVTTHAACGTRNRASAAGTPWSAEEDARLRDEFSAGTSVTEIASLHARTKGGINLRLVHLGLLDASAVKVRDRTRASAP